MYRQTVGWDGLSYRSPSHSGKFSSRVWWGVVPTMSLTQGYNVSIELWQKAGENQQNSATGQFVNPSELWGCWARMGSAAWRHLPSSAAPKCTPPLCRGAVSWEPILFLVSRVSLDTGMLLPSSFSNLSEETAQNRSHVYSETREWGKLTVPGEKWQQGSLGNTWTHWAWYGA